MANSYLARTPSSTGNRKTFTFSAWVKRSKLLDNYPIMFKQVTDASNFVQFYFDNQDHLAFYVENGSGSGYSSLQITNRKFRDVSAWYHVMVAVDTTQASADNRVKIYVNGNQETSFSTNTQINQNIDVSAINTTGLIEIGRASNNSSQHFNGYMTHVSLVDGQQLAPTVFGQTDSTSGIWKFKSPSGVTWGTNGFHLKFENSGNLGLDSSGQTNNFTVNGNLKQALDTPSNVSCTFNPLSTKVIGTVGFSLDNGATVLNPSSNTNQFAMGTLAASAGKWYWEMKSTSSSGNDWPDIGFMFADKVSTHMAATGNPQHNFSYAAAIEANGTRWAFGTQTTSWFGGFSSNAIIMCAVDVTAGKLWWGVDGAWLNSGDPANGTNAGATFTAGTSITPWTEQYNVGDVQANFGNGFFGTTAITSAGSNGNGSLFEYDVPSGYYALNTKNINTYG